MICGFAFKFRENTVPHRNRRGKILLRYLSGQCTGAVCGEYFRLPSALLRLRTANTLSNSLLYISADFPKTLAFFKIYCNYLPAAVRAVKTSDKSSFISDGKASIGEFFSIYNKQLYFF